MLSFGMQKKIHRNDLKLMQDKRMWPYGDPQSIKIDGDRGESYSRFLEFGFTDDAWLSWNDREKMIVFEHKWGIIYQDNSRDCSTPLLLGFSKSIDFTLLSTGSAFESWGDYTAPSFADRHFRHGWACAFKGKGHDRLVSRRWLEWGPWRLIRDEENDLSFVQFHDLDLTPELALEQARPGHQRMGIHDHGGFLQRNYVYEHNLKGIYQPSTQVLEIVINDRELTQCEMLDACAARHYQALGETRPLKNVAFVFFNEEEARAHLHELWLRELECWTFIDGFKTRLDDSYDPGQPVKPDWVLELEAREALEAES